MKRFARSLTSLSQVQRQTASLLPASPATLKFDDPDVLTQSKSRAQLARALCLLHLCAWDRLVANSTPLLVWSRRLLGQRAWRALLRPTLYDQFVGGANRAELGAVVERLAAGGVLPMIMVSLEEPEGGKETEAEMAARLETNLATLLDCLGHTVELSPAHATPLLQVKLTALLPISVLQGLQTAWLAETDGCPNTIARHLVDHLAWALDTRGHEMGSALELRSTDLTRCLQHSLALLRHLMDAAEATGVRLVIDAEYEHINCGLSAVTYAAAMRLNGLGRGALVWNTFQCYLKRTAEAFNNAVAFHNAAQLAFGAKVVRGAYMFHERATAEAEGRPSPVQDSHEATSSNYDDVVERLLRLAAGGGHPTEGIVATHNEASARRAAQRLVELGLNTAGGKVPIVFGQVYGMGDHVSYSLGRAGFSVYKSVPFGTMEETLPYLTRRAQENNSLLKGSRRERDILWKAFFAA